MNIPKKVLSLTGSLEQIILIRLSQFYAIGLVGFMIPYTHNLFVYIIPFSLLLPFAILLWFEFFQYKTTNKKILTAKHKLGYYLLILGVSSYFIEVIGVNDGKLFGPYSYSLGLGWKVLKTPLLIGVNWILLVLGSASIVTYISRFFDFHHHRIIDFLFRIITAVFLMLLFDLVLEPVAPWLDMWHWSTPEVPIANYRMWLIWSTIAQFAFVYFRITLFTFIAGIIFIVQFLFFLLLRLFLFF